MAFFSSYLGPPNRFAFGFLVTIQIAFFLMTMIWPIPNEVGAPVSPLAPSGTDLAHYQGMAARLVDTDVLDITGAYLEFYQSLKIPSVLTVGTHYALSEIRIWEHGYLQNLDVGPAIPTLLLLFDYQTGNTLPLAVLFLILAIANGIVWIFWLHAAGAPTIWLLLFCILPGPLYFMISLGTDLPFCLAMGIFFCAYSGDRWNSRNILVWCGAIAAMILLRPTVLGLLAFVVLDFCLTRTDSITLTRRIVLGLLIFAFSGFALAYYLPRGMFVLGSTSSLIYFGATVGEYYGGLFPNWPFWIDRLLSLSLLVAAKVLYFVGLRPSFGDTSTWIVLVRSAPGLILLPGLIWGFIMSGWRMRFFLLLFLFPILAGPAQDRYSLPIQPILLLYCAYAYSQGVSLLFPNFRGASNEVIGYFNIWIQSTIVKSTFRL